MTAAERDKWSREIMAKNAPRLLAAITIVQSAIAQSGVNTGAKRKAA